MAKVKLGNVKGPKGEQGVRGSKWYNTDKITGESTSGTAFPESGIADAMVGDMALNPTTLNLYTCQTAGNAATAKWVFMACIKGPQGEQGPKGDPTTVDAVLSKDSTNPIQNKAVATKIQDVEDSLGNGNLKNAKSFFMNTTRMRLKFDSDSAHVGAIIVSSGNGSAWGCVAAKDSSVTHGSVKVSKISESIIEIQAPQWSSGIVLPVTGSVSVSYH